MNATLFSIILFVAIIVQNLIWDIRYRSLHAKKNGLESQLETVRASEVRFIEQNRELEKQIKYKSGGFISEKALSHHLNNIQHQSFLYAKYNDDLSAKSIEQSKKIILDKFATNKEKKDPEPPKAPEPRFVYDKSIRQAEKIEDYQRALRFYAKAHRGDLHEDAGNIARQILDKEEKSNGSQ